MNSVVHARQTELAQNTQHIIHTAQQGQTVVIEHHGQPEVAVIDIVDYYILRALAHYYAHPPQVTFGKGLSEQSLANQQNQQAQFDLVLAYYLVEEISLSRAAELLNTSWLDLRTRFSRLDVPLRVAPTNLAEAQNDVANALASLDKG